MSGRQAGDGGAVKGSTSATSRPKGTHQGQRAVDEVPRTRPPDTPAPLPRSGSTARRRPSSGLHPRAALSCAELLSETGQIRQRFPGSRRIWPIFRNFCRVVNIGPFRAFLVDGISREGGGWAVGRSARIDGLGGCPAVPGSALSPDGGSHSHRGRRHGGGGTGAAGAPPGVRARRSAAAPDQPGTPGGCSPAPWRCASSAGCACPRVRPASSSTTSSRRLGRSHHRRRVGRARPTSIDWRDRDHLFAAPHPSADRRGKRGRVGSWAGAPTVAVAE